MITYPDYGGQNPNLSQIILIFVIGIAAITIILLLWLRLRRKGQAVGGRRPKLATVRPVTRYPPKSGADPFFSTAMRAVASRYSLDSVTIATQDGLPLLSTLPDPENEAAQCRVSSSPDQNEIKDGSKRFGIDLDGIPLIGIVRPGNRPSPNWKENIEDDVKIILSLWI